MTDQDHDGVRRALAVGVLLVAVLGGLAGWLGSTAYQDRESDRNREVLLTAARQCATNLTSLDYTQVESDVRRILDCSTGGFRVEFDGRSASLIDVVKRSQSTSAGTVTEAGLESVNGDEGIALVAVTVRTVVAGQGDDRPRSLRMRLTVTREGGEAKVARVDFVT